MSVKLKAVILQYTISKTNFYLMENFEFIMVLNSLVNNNIDINPTVQKKTIIVNIIFACR